MGLNAESSSRRERSLILTFDRGAAALALACVLASGATALAEKAQADHVSAEASPPLAPPPQDIPPAVEGPLPSPPPLKKLAFLIGVGSLDSPGAAGGAFWTGLRLALGPHFAGSVDLGYGLAGRAPSVQDRWWLIPALAVVIPAGPLRVDVGLGAGVGTASGYPTWSSYASAPFSPIWHDTVPIVRVHGSATISMAPNLDLFARAEVASLLFAGSHDGTIDTLWLSFWFGLVIGII